MTSHTLTLPTLKSSHTFGAVTLCLPTRAGALMLFAGSPASASTYDWRMSGSLTTNQVFNDPNGTLNSSFQPGYTYELSFLVDTARATSGPISGSDSLQWINTSDASPFIRNGSIKIYNTDSTLIYQAAFDSSNHHSGGVTAIAVHNNNEIQPNKFSDTLNFQTNGAAFSSQMPYNGLEATMITFGLGTQTTPPYTDGTLPGTLASSQIPTSIDPSGFMYIDYAFVMQVAGNDGTSGIIRGASGGVIGNPIHPVFNFNPIPAYTFSITPVQVPEPSSYALALGSVLLLAIAARRWRK